MSKRSSIYISLEKLLDTIGGSPHNILISLGSDSSLNDLEYYNDLRSRISKDYPTILIFFCDLEDFPPPVRDNFSGNSYLKYFDSSKDELKDNFFSIYLVPYNLPELTDEERDRLGLLDELLFFYSNSQVIFSDEGRDLRVKYNRREMIVPKIDLNVCIDSFMNKDFMILLTQFCLHNIGVGCDIFLLNRYTFNTRGWFSNGSNPIYIEGSGNKYLSKAIYFYPLISLLRKSDKLSLMMERDSSNYLSNLIDGVNLISKFDFFSENLDYLTKDWKDNWESMDDLIDFRFTSFDLQRNILTSDRRSTITIPLSSFSTAFDNNWLDSYAIIVGINKVLKQFDEQEINKVVVCIPEIQHELLKDDGWNSLRRVDLLRGCEILFIPINISGIHWTLLMIDFQSRFGYHFDSLLSDSKKGGVFDMNKDSKDLRSNYHIANKICNKILNCDVNNIFLDDQDNSYDCGGFILLHLQILLNSYINNYNFVDYLKSKLEDLDISMKIKKIRESIYSLLDNSSLLIEELDKDKDTKKTKKTKKTNRISNKKKGGKCRSRKILLKKRRKSKKKYIKSKKILK